MTFFDTQTFEKLILNNSLATDSRQVQPGNVFLAIHCPNVHNHLQQALDAGASAIILEKRDSKDWSSHYPSVQFIVVENSRYTLARIASLLYQGQPSHVVAVTGTNGKSSTVHMTRQLWQGCSYSAANLGSLGLTINDNEPHSLDLPYLNTLDPLSAHKTLQYLKQNNVDYLAFEASSHGLHQYRQHAIDLEVAGFTNLNQDHLDYHITMEDYFLAKAKLFSEVLPIGKTAVINFDSPYFKPLQKICQELSQKVLSYSIQQEADLFVKNIQQHDTFIEFDLNLLGQNFAKQKVNLVGRFQLENLLCALGLAIATGAPINKLIEILPFLTAVKGRMELVGSYNKAAIYVDYSHKPEALKTALENLRHHTKNKLWVVFGCGGNRDDLKRPKMGQIALSYADQVIVTDDNPRFEEAAEIRKQVLIGCPQADEIGDRRQAIHSTIAKLQEGDVLLIAGKGHESGQIVGDTIYPFDDRIEVETFLKERDYNG